MRKYSFRFVRENINWDEINITYVECKGNSFFNIIMATFFGIASIIGIILTVDMLHNLEGVLAFCFINLMFIGPFSYLLLKIINYSFLIENDKIMYKNIFGNIYEYDFRDIKDVKHIIGSHRIPEIFIIKMEDRKNIVISDYSTNFDLLKLKFRKERLIDNL